METTEKLTTKHTRPNNDLEFDNALEGIDVTRIIKDAASAFRHKKRFIFAITIASGILGGIFNLVTPKTYEAFSLVSNVYVRPRIDLLDVSPGADVAREKNFSYLLNGGELVSSVLEQLKAMAPESIDKNLTPDRLLRTMNSTQEGDILTINIKSKDPNLAALTANLWANTYVAHVNRLYSLGILEEDKQTLKQEYDRAKESYKSANQDWIDFVRRDDIQSLELQIKNLETLRNTLSDAQQVGFLEHSADAKRSLVSLLSQRFELGQRLAEAKSLAAQIKSEEKPSIGSHMALILLKINVYAASGQQQRFDLSPSVAASSIDQRANQIEADELCKAIEARLANLNELISITENKVARGSGLDALTSPSELGTRIEKLEQKIYSLRETVARKQGVRKLLDNQLQISEGLFKNISSKWQTFLTASAFSGNEVRLASAAFPPNLPTAPKSIFVYILFFALVGFLVSWTMSFLREYRLNTL